MVTTPFAVIIVVYGLLLRSSHSSFWRTQRDDEDITISLQYITSKRHGKESVQVSVVFDRPSRTTGTLLTSDTPTTKSPSRPNLSLSSHTNALIHAMLGPDELLLMIEGPSLQAAIATVGMNDSHQTGVMNIPIAGNTNTYHTYNTHTCTHTSNLTHHCYGWHEWLSPNGGDEHTHCW